MSPRVVRTPEERAQALRDATRRYHQTPKGKAALKRAQQRQKERGWPAKKKWEKNNPHNWRQRTYGLTKEQWADLSKDGCGICGVNENLVCDHDHQTGRIRGALCQTCNVGIGFLKDDPSLVARALKWLGGVP